METTTIELNMMYGDHHVIEVRKIISSLQGVEDIYASSCFRVVEVTFDESKVDAETIEKSLEEAGYVGEMDLPVEKGVGSSAPNGQNAYFRHTAASEQTGNVVSFAQTAPYDGRPLWPCPGVGALQDDE